VAPVFIVQVFQYLTMLKNAKKSEAGREAIKAQVSEVKNDLATIQTTKDDVRLLIAGAERENIKAGIEIGKAQSSGPAPLGDA
jgi:hypothetical protein